MLRIAAPARYASSSSQMMQWRHRLKMTQDVERQQVDKTPDVTHRPAGD